jgi:hypothetical protein
MAAPRPTLRTIVDIIAAAWDQCLAEGRTLDDLWERAAKIAVRELVLYRYAKVSDWPGQGPDASLVSRVVREEPTITPEMTLAEAGIPTRRQARYQRRMSRLLGGDA